ncbi:DNA (cytosine-5)-methyltransferase CMT3-like [Mangifera indica]|uniref:DNA (cytosine-5)-methyltransferase CMT3-like n=1 Tax=Mangifera indica TaxID=29780 RepID=UPI001CFC1B32|nr:DNA (cytosine-5)-methyltransferase CMT3-like [Mangifera indica]
MPRKRKSTPSAAASAKKPKLSVQEPEPEIETHIDDGDVDASSQSSDSVVDVKKHRASLKNAAGSGKKLTVRGEKRSDDEEEPEARFIGDPVPDKEARQRWPKRYEEKKGKQKSVSKNSKEDDDSEEFIQARCHYTQAEVDGCVFYNLYDDAHVKVSSFIHV